MVFEYDTGNREKVEERVYEMLSRRMLAEDVPQNYAEDGNPSGAEIPTPYTPKAEPTGLEALFAPPEIGEVANMVAGMDIYGKREPCRVTVVVGNYGKNK